MHIWYFDERKVQTVASEEEAREIINDKYPNAVINDRVDFFEETEFYLVWRNQEEAEDDCGIAAVAKIVVVEEVA